MSLWAILDVFHTIMAVGHYEDRITVVTHGSADVVPAWLAYEVWQQLMPRGDATIVADRFWIAGSVVAAVAVVIWLVRTRRNAAWAWAWASVLIAVLVQGLFWVYQAVTSAGGAFDKTALDTRWVAYPLWTVASLVTVLAAIRTARAVRQAARQGSAGA
ncbi:hypothetical protein [Rhizocola hellebori]|uniref:hypothetical protein n=1 Tax=Rhizocola hellebori TaxID=1392758 RepID=UPI00194397DA|nr:hypothetical protein [Rhizocola hellebori]